jgi:acetoin utilization protein AcuC
MLLVLRSLGTGTESAANTVHHHQGPDGGERYPRTPLFIGSEIYRRSTYGPKHPLAIPRVSTVTDLCRALGWLPEAAYVTARMATDAQLTRFHDPAYVAALRRAEATQAVTPEDRARFRIGADSNPVYREVFSRPATGAGGMLTAAGMTGAGGVVHVPGGGTHHGRPDRASGFCYLNDPVLGILAWLDAGLTRVVYLDLDAHHGDGVQDAFLDEPRVRFVSIHEQGRWPHSGAADDAGHGYACNLPVPAGFNDSELGFLMDAVVLPLAGSFRPEVVVVTCGTDALAGDPLSGMALTNLALWDAVERVIGAREPAVVLGGGGYNPWTLARCWTGLWGRLSGRPIPVVLPAPAQLILRSLECDLVDDDEVDETWFATLADAPRPGEVRAEVKSLASQGRTLHGLA